MSWPVLLLARELDLVGGERQMTEIAKGLDRRRFEPHVGCFRLDGMRGRELRAAGIPITHFRVAGFVSLGALGGAAQLVRYVRRWKIRLHLGLPLTAFAAPVARFLTPPRSSQASAPTGS